MHKTKTVFVSLGIKSKQKNGSRMVDMLIDNIGKQLYKEALFNKYNNY